jgi:hypothetical protein
MAFFYDYFKRLNCYPGVDSPLGGTMRKRVFLSPEKETWYKRNGPSVDYKAQENRVCVTDEGEPIHGGRGYLEASH